VGGGVEAGESLQQAAGREAHEETGIAALPIGTPVWTRDHTYRFDGRTMEVHEDWLLHPVEHFEPAPAGLSDYETSSIVGFRWWSAEELSHTTDTVFPPALGELLSALLRDGPPSVPADLTEHPR
jgi:8-oxo-dGTP pyrophosphatase MutT (NUDIX family)